MHLLRVYHKCSHHSQYNQLLHYLYTSEYNKIMSSKNQEIFPGNYILCAKTLLVPTYPHVKIHVNRC